MCWISTLQAVVVNEADGSGNTTAPEDDPGFANVGFRGGGSAIYLGNRWVLTAAHVMEGPVEFEGVTYANELGETYRLMNSGGNLSDNTDMILFRLEEDPGLPALRLGCDPVTGNSTVTLVGGGRDRAPEQSHWIVEEGPENDDDDWSPSDEDVAERTGYQTLDSRSLRWGNSIVTKTNFDAESGSGDVLSFQTTFHPIFPVTNLAQGVRGDSGGAAFQKNDGVWELVGMMHAISLYENQPNGTKSAVFGNETFVAELYDYADQIREIADFEPAVGDADGDGQFTAYDIDRMFEVSRDLSNNSCHFDMTGDGRVWRDDLETLVEQAGTIFGDANMDGEVDFADFLTVSRNYGETDAGWEMGDFDGDKQVTFGDYLLVSQNFGQVVNSGFAAAAAAIPEPSTAVLLGIAFLPCLALRRRNFRS